MDERLRQLAGLVLKNLVKSTFKVSYMRFQDVSRPAAPATKQAAVLCSGLLARLAGLLFFAFAVVVVPGVGVYCNLGTPPPQKSPLPPSLRAPRAVRVPPYSLMAWVPPRPIVPIYTSKNVWKKNETMPM